MTPPDPYRIPGLPSAAYPPYYLESASETPPASSSSSEHLAYSDAWHSTSPFIPATYLPSYYPENRGFESLPSQTPYGTISYTRQAHLLDGVALASPPQQPPRIHSAPSYGLSPEDNAQSIGMTNLPRPWKPKSRGPWIEPTERYHSPGSSSGGDRNGAASYLIAQDRMRDSDLMTPMSAEVSRSGSRDYTDPSISNLPAVLPTVLNTNGYLPPLESSVNTSAQSGTISADNYAKVSFIVDLSDN
jgi:hypothetical protein